MIIANMESLMKNGISTKTLSTILLVCILLPVSLAEQKNDPVIKGAGEILYNGIVLPDQ